MPGQEGAPGLGPDSWRSGDEPFATRDEEVLPAGAVSGEAAVGGEAAEPTATHEPAEVAQLGPDGVLRSATEVASAGPSEPTSAEPGVVGQAPLRPYEPGTSEPPAADDGPENTQLGPEAAEERPDTPEAA